MSGTKRGLILSDFHCGHRTGLTPPAYQRTEYAPSSVKASKWMKVQRQTWGAFKALLAKHEPYDFCLLAGDLIEGKGGRSGGTELITADRIAQADIASECINSVRLHGAEQFDIYSVFGTPSHTSHEGGEDWEQIVADKAGVKSIGSHEWFDCNGCIIDIKHTVGSSGIPHGRHTAIAKERLWNVLWAQKQAQPKADVLLRGHVHYYNYCGGTDWLGMTLPALQGLGTKYGSRQCSGVVDWGLVVCEIDEDGKFSWTAEIAEIAAHKAKSVKI